MGFLKMGVDDRYFCIIFEFIALFCILVFGKSNVPDRTHSYRHTAAALCGSPIGLWEKYYYASFDITHYFSSNVGFRNICCSVYKTGRC